MALLQQYRF